MVNIVNQIKINVSPIKNSLKAAALVPGLPHLLKTDENAGYAALAGAMEKVGDAWAAAGVKRLLYFSTQWISVLGHSFQAKADLKGLHVDDNWHDVADLPFAFKIDTAFATKLAETMHEADYQTRMVDYEGFPVDTGTIVADQLLNKGRFKAAMLSCCVYSDGADTEKFTKLLAETIAADPVPTAVVVVSGLSHRFFTTEIDLREDHIREASDDVWNKRILGHLEKAQYSDLEAALPEFAKATKAEMGFKAYHVLKGFGAAAGTRPGQCLAYGALYGTGAAVVAF